MNTKMIFALWPLLLLLFAALWDNKDLSGIAMFVTVAFCFLYFVLWALKIKGHLNWHYVTIFCLALGLTVPVAIFAMLNAYYF